MQHIAFDKLLTGVSQNLRAGDFWPHVHQCRRVLQLVAKTKRPTGLIVGRAPPHATAQVLVRQPTVDHEVNFAIRSFDRDDRKQGPPELLDAFECSFDFFRFVILANQFRSDFAVGSFAQYECATKGAAWGQFDRQLPGGARIEAAARTAVELVA